MSNFKQTPNVITSQPRSENRTSDRFCCFCIPCCCIPCDCNCGDDCFGDLLNCLFCCWCQELCSGCDCSDCADCANCCE